MSRPMVNPGTLLWTGQHWINYIRLPDTEHNSGMVSLWHTHYCAAGEGTVAFIDIQGDPGFQGICTDNNAIATFIQDWVRGYDGFYGKDFPFIEALIIRSGDILCTPSWIIETESDRIVATWSEIRPPVIMDAPAPKFKADKDVYSLLNFADGATILWNDHPVAGTPYDTEIWQPSIGGTRSSCVFALSETFIESA